MTLTVITGLISSVAGLLVGKIWDGLGVLWMVSVALGLCSIWVGAGIVNLVVKGQLPRDRIKLTVIFVVIAATTFMAHAFAGYKVPAAMTGFVVLWLAFMAFTYCCAIFKLDLDDCIKNKVLAKVMPFIEKHLFAAIVVAWVVFFMIVGIGGICLSGILQPI